MSNTTKVRWRRIGVVLSVLWLVAFGGWMWLNNVNSVNESYSNALQHCVDLSNMRGEREVERYTTEVELRGWTATGRARMEKTMEMNAEEMTACWRRTTESYRFVYSNLRTGVRLLALIDLASVALFWLLTWIIIRTSRWVAA
jgi:hypothetical protein